PRRSPKVALGHDRSQGRPFPTPSSAPPASLWAAAGPAGPRAGKSVARRWPRRLFEMRWLVFQLGSRWDRRPIGRAGDVATACPGADGPRSGTGVLDRFGSQIRAIGGSDGRGAIGLVGATESREGSLMGQEPEPHSDRMLRCRRTEARNVKGK